MCGIIGYLGESHTPQEVILEGLKRLEYRGYDSAGITVIEDGELHRVRALGRLASLQEKLTTENLKGKVGIGHTRWATHGVPAERNAHPHIAGEISIVHNGIIENYAEVRKKLLLQGVLLESETDTELVAHLISAELKITNNLLSAVKNTLTQIQGAFAIVVMWSKEPHRLIGFKDGPPLVIGIGKNENFLSSDPNALLKYTREYVFIEDREIVEIQKDSYSIYNFEGEKINRKSVHLDWNADQIERRGFAHFMLKEIYEQPQTVSNALAPHVNLATYEPKLMGIGWSSSSFHEMNLLDLVADRKITESKLSQIKRIQIIACGTSFYAAMVGKYNIEQMARIPVDVDIASEYRYRSPIIESGTLVLTISQSGETADTLAALRLAKGLGAITLSLCNARGSTIDREAHGHLYMNAGVEIGVASTKAFSASLTMLNLFALDLSYILGSMPPQKIKEAVAALVALPSQMETVLTCDKYFAKAAQSLKAFKGFLFLGRGTNFPIALEGALKLKELAYLHAEGYAAGEMKHGPLALVDENMAVVTVAPSDALYDKTISNLEEARARGAKIISVGTGENSELRNVSQHYLPIPKTHPIAHAVLAILPLQLMAYHLAVALGHDVDKPRNLAKSVTVE